MKPAPPSTSDTIDRWAAWWKRSSSGTRRRRLPRCCTSSSRRSRKREKVIVGVNDFIQSDEKPIEILYIDDQANDTQLTRLAELKEDA